MAIRKSYCIITNNKPFAMYQPLLFTIIFVLSLYACNTSTEQENTSPATTPSATVVSPAVEEPIILTDEQKQTYADLGINIEQGIPVGLKLGESAPVFKQNDQHGEEIFMPDMLKKGPLVVLFYRGQWCPACDRYLSGLSDSIELIKSTGANVVIVTPETAENINKTEESTGIDAHIISDNSGLLMDAFKVSFFVTEAYQEKINTKYATDIAVSNGSKVAKLPVPATFIINKNGHIVWRQFDVDYHNRASANEILQALEAVQ